MANVLAVDIGSCHFRVGLFGQTGSCLKIAEERTPAGQPRDWLLEQIRNHCLAYQQESSEPVTACAVSFGGLVDYEQQVVTSLQCPDWDRFPLAAWLRQSLGLPCRADGDANAAALAEYRFGAGQGTDSMALVMISTGLRSSLICRGQIWRGNDSLAGEIGHVPVSDSGAPCSCGASGCLEHLCSGAAIARDGRDFARRRPEGRVAIVEHSSGSIKQITARTVAEAAAHGDDVALHIMGDAARWLARAILAIIRIVNPEKIILGGGVAQAGPVLMEPLQEALTAGQSSKIRHSTAIVTADLGTHSSLYGAAVLALDLAAEGKPITT